MNYGPLEFADYLRRKDRADSATVRAARAAQPGPTAPVNLLRVVSGPATPRPVRPPANAVPASVLEALAVNPPAPSGSGGEVRISVMATPYPLILVLSAHQSVQWKLGVAPGAELRAVLLSGFGQSVVTGAPAVPVHRIGGFYAFRRGSVEFGHLESEVRRCTGHAIGQFRSIQVGASLQLRPE